MKSIYLDNQLFIDYFDNREGKVELSKITDFQLVYSAAHCEEILVYALTKEGKEKAKNRIDLLSMLTGNCQIVVNEQYLPVIAVENVSDCYGRCERYELSNRIAESTQRIIVEDGYNYLIQSSINPSKDNRDPIIDILQNPDILDEIIKRAVSLISGNLALEVALSNNLICHPIKEEHEGLLSRLSKYFCDNDLIMHVIFILNSPRNLSGKAKDVVYRSVLDVVHRTLIRKGYKLDGVEKSRSTLHDSSHIEYASYCDYFVTRDKKLFLRTRAIFEFLGIQTEVILADKTNSWFSKFCEKKE